MMRDTSFYLITAVAVIALAGGLRADGSDGPSAISPPSLFLKQVPTDLTSKIGDKLALVRAALNPAAKSAADEARKYAETTAIDRMMPLGFEKAGSVVSGHPCPETAGRTSRSVR